MSQRVGLVFSVFKKRLRLARTSEVTLSSPCSSRVIQNIQAAQAHVQRDSEYIRGQTLHNLSVQLVPVLGHPYSCVMIRQNLLYFTLSSLPLGHHWEQPNALFLTPLSDICTHPWGCPEASLLRAEQSQCSQPYHDGIFSTIFQHSIFQDIYKLKLYHYWASSFSFLTHMEEETITICWFKSSFPKIVNLHTRFLSTGVHSTVGLLELLCLHGK